MFADFKQFVPSDYCFQCKGCCVFESSVTPWRPLLAQEEKLRSCLHDTEACFDNETVDRVIAYQKQDWDYIKQSIPDWPEGATNFGAYVQGNTWNHR